MEESRTVKKRTLVFLVLPLVFAFLALFKLLGYANTWHIWNIPTTPLHFSDLRVITHSGISIEQGHDPLLNNPGDPWQRKLNYPRIWQHLNLLGMNPSWTTAMGIVLITLFLVGFCIFPSHLDRLTISILMAGLLSPAVLLAVERGNIDLLMFFLMSVALAISQKSSVISLGLCLFAFFLKLFPIFGLGLFLKEKYQHFAWHLTAGLGIAGLYLISIYSDLGLISSATESGKVMSYGTNVLSLNLEARGIMFPSYQNYLIYGIAGLIIAGSFFFGSRLRANSPTNHIKSLEAFRVGTGIYLGTFLLGSNWDYRLIFLLFTLPCLVSLLKTENRLIKVVSTVSLVAILSSLWHFILGEVFWRISGGTLLGFLVDELMNWIAFGSLACLFVCLLPKWFWSASRSS